MEKVVIVDAIRTPMGAHRGANRINNDNLFHCDSLSRFQLANRTGWLNCWVIGFVMARFITQPFRHVIQLGELKTA